MGRKTKRNVITSPELLAKVNPKNMQLLDDFVEYLHSAQRSESTIKVYTNDLHICFVWSLQYNDNAFYCDWTKRQIMKLQNWLIYENENSPARVRRIRAALSSLGNFIESVLDDEYPNYRNIINRIEAPVLEQVREKTVLSDDDVKMMLNGLVKKKKYKEACFVALAAYSGRRKAELCRFRVDDFSDDKLICGGSLWKSAPIRTKGRGAGKMIPCYVLVSQFKPYLDLWLSERKRLGIDSEWLFPGISRKDMISTSAADVWMADLSRFTKKNIYAHSFRHYFTTMLSNSGLPDSVIKDIIQWKDISMVGVYIDRDTDTTLDMYFDKDGIKRMPRKFPFQHAM